MSAKPSPYKALKAPVSNRGSAPDAFLTELIAWGKSAPDEIFAPRKDAAGETDIYTSIRGTLGPWENLKHRRAALLEVLRVLAGFESSWNWKDGRDITNSTSGKPHTEEAGAWQVSGNSQLLGKDLETLVIAMVKDMDSDGDIDFADWRAAMKLDHPLAMEYVARLLRHTIRHNGPVKRREIHRWLSRAAVAEFETHLAA